MASKKVASAYIDLQLQTAQFKAAIGEATNQTKKWSASMREETQKSRESVRLLSEELGLGVPRGLQNIISKLPGVSTAMNLAFDSVVVFALIKTVVEVTEKVGEFIKKNEEAAKKNAQAWNDLSAPIDAANDKMQVTNDKLEEQIAKFEHKPANELRTALDEAVDSADSLYRKLVLDNRAAAELLVKQQVGWGSRAIGQQSTDEISGQVTDQQSKVDRLAEIRANNARAFSKQISDTSPAQREAIAAKATKQWNEDTQSLIKGLDSAAAKMQSYYNGADALQKKFSGKGLGSYDYTNILSIAGGQAHNFQSQANSARLEQQNLVDTSTLSKDKTGSEILSKLIEQEKAKYRQLKDAAKEGFREYHDELTDQFDHTQQLQDKANTKAIDQDKESNRAGIEALRQRAQTLAATYGTDRESAASGYKGSEADTRGMTTSRRLAVLQQELTKEHDLQTQSYASELDLYNDGSKEYQNVLREKLRADTDYYSQLKALQYEAHENSVSGAFADLIKRSQDFNAQFREMLDSTIGSINDALMKLMTEKDHRGAFKDAGKQIFSNVAKIGLQDAEGGIMKALHLGSGKLGTQGNPMWVKMAGTVAGGGAVTSAISSATSAAGAASSGGFFSSLFSGLAKFGGYMATGGVMSPGDFYLTGEQGPELVQVGSTSRINNARDTAGMFSGSGGTTHEWHIDARGANDPAAIHAAVQRGIMQAAPHIIAASNAVHMDSKRRTPTSKS